MSIGIRIWAWPPSKLWYAWQRRSHKEFEYGIVGFSFVTHLGDRAFKRLQRQYSELKRVTSRQSICESQIPVFNGNIVTAVGRDKLTRLYVSQCLCRSESQSHNFHVLLYYKAWHQLRGSQQSSEIALLLLQLPVNRSLATHQSICLPFQQTSRNISSTHTAAYRTPEEDALEMSCMPTKTHDADTRLSQLLSGLRPC